MHWIDGLVVLGGAALGYGIGGIAGMGAAVLIIAITLALGDYYRDD